MPRPSTASSTSSSRLGEDRAQRPSKTSSNQSPSTGSTRSARHGSEGSFQSPERDEGEDEVEVDAEGEGGKAKAPVRLACLTCRQRKSKCDGVQPKCGYCAKKNLDCSWAKSRRGGARVKGSGKANACPAPAAPSDARRRPSNVKSAFPSSTGEGAPNSPEPLAVFLRSVGRLTQPSALMAPHPDSITLSPLTLQQPEEPRPLSPQARAFQQPDQQQALPSKPRSYDIVRTFQSVEEIIQAYYREIYPYLPLLPHPSCPTNLVISSIGHNPPSTPPASSQASSPLILAILTLLALEPQPTDPAPDSEASKSLRSRAAEAYARDASRSLEQALSWRALVQSGELDGELSEEGALELVQAAVVLAKYEFAERGDVSQMKERTYQAVQLAMGMGLHLSDDHFTQMPDWVRDTRRKTWWMTFLTNCEFAIFTNSSPLVDPFDRRMTVGFPLPTLDQETWPSFLECVRQLTLASILSSASLQPSPLSPTATQELKDDMVALDGRLLALIEQERHRKFMALREDEIDSTWLPEEEMTQSFERTRGLMLNEAMVLLHRPGAFPAVAFYSSERRCGLTADRGPVEQGDEDRPDVGSREISATAERFRSLTEAGPELPFKVLIPKPDLSFSSPVSQAQHQEPPEQPSFPSPIFHQLYPSQQQRLVQELGKPPPPTGTITTISPSFLSNQPLPHHAPFPFSSSSTSTASPPVPASPAQSSFLFAKRPSQCSEISFDSYDSSTYDYYDSSFELSPRELRTNPQLPDQARIASQSASPALGTNDLFSFSGFNFSTSSSGVGLGGRTPGSNFKAVLFNDPSPFDSLFERLEPKDEQPAFDPGFAYGSPGAVAVRPQAIAAGYQGHASLSTLPGTDVNGNLFDHFIPLTEPTPFDLPDPITPGASTDAEAYFDSSLGILIAGNARALRDRRPFGSLYPEAPVPIPVPPRPTTITPFLSRVSIERAYIAAWSITEIASHQMIDYTRVLSRRPRAHPFCSCGILSAVFVLLLLSIVADIPVQTLLGRVDSIAKTLRSFGGIYWSGINGLADEIERALAATQTFLRLREERSAAETRAIGTTGGETTRRSA